MYIKNTMDNDVYLNSFNGYKITIPKGTVWIWAEAGEYAMNIYGAKGNNGKIEYKDEKPVFVKQEQTTPPIVEGNQEDWEKEGKKLAMTERFKINPTQYTDGSSRKHLIKVAQERGVHRDRILEFLADEQIPNEDIIQNINDLPVPEELRYPKELETNEEATQKKEETTV